MHRKSLYLLCLLLAGCSKPADLKETSQTPCPPSSVIVDMHIASSIHAEPFFEAVVNACKRYGEVKIIDCEQVLFEEDLDADITLDIHTSSLQEGNPQKIPRVLGKVLPVLKVSVNVIDHLAEGKYPFHQNGEEYVGVGDKSETTKRSIEAFQNLMADFDGYYKRCYPKAAQPFFKIQIPFILERFQEGISPFSEASAISSSEKS